MKHRTLSAGVVGVWMVVALVVTVIVANAVRSIRPKQTPAETAAAAAAAEEHARLDRNRTNAAKNRSWAGAFPPLPQSAPNPSPTPAPERGLSDFENQQNAEIMLRMAARDRGSFEKIGWKRHGGNRWGITYRAKNGFGGYSVEEQLFIFSPKGVVPVEP